MVLSNKGRADRKDVSGRRSKGIVPFVIMLLLSFVVTAQGADQIATGPSDTSKKCMDRVKTFLMRSNEDVDRSLSLVQETIALLEEQSDTSGLIETVKSAGARGELLEWYRGYTDWLSGMDTDVQADLTDFFSHPRPDEGTTGRYEEIAKGYQRMADKLGMITQKLEEDGNKIESRIQKLNRAVQERRVLVEKADLELAKELRPTSRDRRPSDYQVVAYRDLADDEVERYRWELRSLGEQRTYLNVLSEISQYELNWITMKAEDSATLDVLGSVIESEATGPLVKASRGIIKTYESDVMFLKSSVDEIKGKLHGMTRTGSFKTLDRFEELSRHYEKMKTRYERHIEWLKGQIGSYQADLVVLDKDR